MTQCRLSLLLAQSPENEGRSCITDAVEDVCAFYAFVYALRSYRTSRLFGESYLEERRSSADQRAFAG